MIKNTFKIQNRDKLFSVDMLIFSFIGLLINLILARLVSTLGLPLYVDNVGSILVAILGGVLPGITVGFLSNIIGSLSNPISMYYSVFTIAIAGLASFYSQKYLLRNLKGWLISIGSFVLIGGAAGSIMTWFLYGQSISGIAKPYAQTLSAHGISPFWAQWITDIIIDIPDKIITVALVWVLLKLCIKIAPSRFPYSYIYEKDNKIPLEINENIPGYHRKTSVQRRITGIVTLAVVIVGLFSLVTATFYYNKQSNIESKYAAQMVSAQAALCVDGDELVNQLETGRSSDGYKASESKLYSLYEKSSEYIKFIYIYRITEDGIFVIYDLDVPGVPGAKVGTHITDDDDIGGRINDFISGGDVSPGSQSDKNGTLVSAYTPIYNSKGETVAYACADVDISNYTNDLLVYIARNAALVFAVILLSAYITVWFVNYHVTNPIRSIVSHTKKLAQIKPENWLDSDAWKDKTPICTNDEIEELYTAITQTEQYASINVRKRIETEQELIQTKALEEANKNLEKMILKADEANQAKTEFFSRMSHDMRTPMNGILGLAELSEDETDIKVLKDNNIKIKQSGQYLLGLINDTLDFQKIESGKLVLEPQFVSARELISNVILMIKLEANKKNISLNTTTENMDLDSLFKVDPMRIKQILFNILSNAVKFTQPGGTIEMHFKRINHAENLFRDIITITDTGIGMSQEFLDNHIFQPFSQEHSDIVTNYAGSGLGLSIVKQLLELMGGSINVESALGKGTKFTIVIDFEHMNEPKTNNDYLLLEEKQNEIKKLLKNKNILLAEDHPLNAEITKKLLHKAGCKVDWVKDGQECYNAFIQSEESHYDVILMDIRMPNVDGISAARMIRENSTRSDARTIPIIAMTANAYDTDVRNCLEAGMNAHIAKPLDVEKMYQVIASFIN